jgi:hypothetical protein
VVVIALTVEVDRQLERAHVVCACRRTRGTGVMK